MLVTMLYVFKPQRRSGYRIEQQLDWTSEGIEILEPTVGKRDRDADEWVWTEGTRYQEFLQSWPKKLGNCGSIHLV